MPTTNTPTQSRPVAVKRIGAASRTPNEVTAKSAPAPVKSKPIKLKRGQLGAAKKGVLNLPATGGYTGGNRTGRAMALNLLKEMRASEPGFGFLKMQHMILEFVKRMELDGGHATFDRPVSERSDAESSRKGQYVGFFQELCHWTEDAVRQMGSQLDSLSEDELLTSASNGLNFDMDEWYKRDEKAGVA